MSDDHEDNLTTEQAARRIGVSPRTLEKWRMIGQGPAFLPAGKHRVVYPVRWIVEWEEALKATSTAQKKWVRIDCSMPPWHSTDPTKPLWAIELLHDALRALRLALRLAKMAVLPQGGVWASRTSGRH